MLQELDISPSLESSISVVICSLAFRHELTVKKGWEQLE